MKLGFICTIGHKHFRLDDVEDEAPMMQIEFYNELMELPYELRKKAAEAALWKSAEVLAGVPSSETRLREGLRELLESPHYQGHPLTGGAYCKKTVMVSAAWYEKLRALLSLEGDKRTDGK